MKPGVLNNEKGAALVIALLTMTVLTLIGVASINTTSLDLMISGNYKNSVKALTAAEAGVHEVIARMQSLIDRGIIRDPSPVFDLHKLGYCSTLAALNVPRARLDEVAEIVNARPEVTHNYLREGEPNLWFTVIAASEAERDAILGDIERRAACGPVRAYPATRTFRVRVAFEFSHGDAD